MELALMLTQEQQHSQGTMLDLVAKIEQLEILYTGSYGFVVAHTLRLELFLRWTVDRGLPLVHLMV